MLLTSSANGKYILTVAAESAWVNAENRVFQVTIDPPIYTGSSTSAIEYQQYFAICQQQSESLLEVEYDSVDS